MEDAGGMERLEDGSQHEPTLLLSLDSVGSRGVRGELASLETLTRALECCPSRDVLSVGSSVMEPLLLCICETGRERRRWDTVGEWGAARCAPCSLSCEWSMFGAEFDGCCCALPKKKNLPEINNRDRDTTFLVAAMVGKQRAVACSNGGMGADDGRKKKRKRATDGSIRLWRRDRSRRKQAHFVGREGSLGGPPSRVEVFRDRPVTDCFLFDACRQEACCPSTRV